MLWFHQCTPFQPRAYSKTFMTMMQFENLGCCENRILVYFRFRILDSGGQVLDFLTSFGFCVTYFHVTPTLVGGLATLTLMNVKGVLIEFELCWHTISVASPLGWLWHLEVGSLALDCANTWERSLQDLYRHARIHWTFQGFALDDIGVTFLPFCIILAWYCLIYIRVLRLVHVDCLTASVTHCLILMLPYEIDCTLTISESTSQVTASQGCHHVVELLPNVFGQEISAKLPSAK